MSMIQPSTREPVEGTPRKSFPVSALPILTERQKERCAHCEDRIVTYFAKGRMHLRGYHIDHILPLELGGQHVIANWQLLCVPCHKAKTREDIKRIRKAQRLERDHDPETRRQSRRPIRSRGFPKADNLR